MEVISLAIYGMINLLMLISCLIKKGDIFKPTFWFSLISLGWFFPQALGSLEKSHVYPDNGYIYGLLFASLCSLAFYFGWIFSHKKSLKESSMYFMEFDEERLYKVAVFLIMFGLYFQAKLWSLPEDILSNSTWTGIPVMLLFFSHTFRFGFLILWIQYLKSGKILSTKYLIFLVPCVILFIDIAFLKGRRAEMMNIVSYLFIGLWFVKRIIPSRVVIITALIFGLIFINTIGAYRSIIKDDYLSTGEKIEKALDVNYLALVEDQSKNATYEFDNYTYARSAIGKTTSFDYGVYHWNTLVFNYIPAQIVGNEFKDFFYFSGVDVQKLSMDNYYHSFNGGSTVTGYLDSFISFGWLGFIKFVIIGILIGYLYRYSMAGGVISQILYLYLLNHFMLSVTHNTNEFLTRHWVYFFCFIFPLLIWARCKE
ncbi:O-antigen polymerase [Vibrio sp. 1978]|uniref:O-antigen polymerase n=1 Tax=Vibrio sp. 1978 TaxID=3074585 RepID=UPI00296634F9|nr:O-antigen polymerase [Vibrio sp. 1978]MDW3056444.1 O-antigen polymerase [Vibrio sp. 1978]